MKTYEDGLNEAWELMRRIADISKYAWVKSVFGDVGTLNILRDYSALEAIAKVKEYEEIKVGDEVDDGEWKGTITWISPDGEFLVVMLEDGTAIRWNKKDFKKTGRHFSQIAEVLEQMKERKE